MNGRDETLWCAPWMEWRVEVWECADGLGVRQAEVNRAEGRRVIRRASNARVRSCGRGRKQQRTLKLLPRNSGQMWEEEEESISTLMVIIITPCFAARDNRRTARHESAMRLSATSHTHIHAHRTQTVHTRAALTSETLSLLASSTCQHARSYTKRKDPQPPPRH